MFKSVIKVILFKKKRKGKKRRVLSINLQLDQSERLFLSSALYHHHHFLLFILNILK
jgi:hypothetical protein